MLAFSAGLYDMMGNTWEWTSSIFPSAKPMYVLRGASWIDTADGSANHKARVTTRWCTTKKKKKAISFFCKLWTFTWLTDESVSSRMGNTPDSASDNLGFRCAASHEQKTDKSRDEAEL